MSHVASPYRTPRTFLSDLFPLFLMQTAKDLNEVRTRVVVGDLDGALDLVRRIQATSRHFGAHSLASAASALEDACHLAKLDEEEVTMN